MKTMTRKLLSVSCPNVYCKENLVFASDATTVYCQSCGEQHKKETITDVFSFHESKKPGDTKVNGISCYMCKLLSPLLTRYGMTKDTGEAKLLSQMGKGEIFDCSRLSSRAFLIEPCNLNVPGYGCDTTGSLDYLAETLCEIKKANANDERLVPIHADGDGHCLVHAISRALVGRELFWHALRENLQLHFQEKLELYKMHFQDFIYLSEWQEIIDECKPDFVPREGELLGLRNIHIFGLANVLKRPIVLLDSIDGMNSSGDYSGVFLPALCNKQECLDKDGQLNKPLCIAWSSSGRNHYIPLVGIEGKPAPRLPRSMLQKAWGMPVNIINEYVNFDENGCCTIGGNKLSDRYIRKLIDAMEKVYYEKNLVQPSLVADTYQLLRRDSVIDSMKPDTVMHICKQLIQQCQLYRCLNCKSLNNCNIPQDRFINTGQLEVVLRESYIKDIVCEDCKVNRLRLVKANGNICYQNGDLVSNPQGNKYYWNGIFYNNLPQVLPLTLEWKNKNIAVKVLWFENESDASLDSNAYEIGQQLVHEHFPGEFNTESLVTSLVNQILELTKIKDSRLAATAAHPETDSGDSTHLLPGRDEKDSCTEFKQEVLSEKASLFMQTLDSAILSDAVREQKSRSVVSGPQQTKQIHSATEKVENQIGAVGKPEPQEEIPKPVLTQKSSQIKSATPKPSPCKTLLPAASKVKCPPTKNIRLSTSTGQKILLSLEKDVSFEELQALITKKLGIPANRQKIRMGFPPRQFTPATKNEQVPLNHGDRLEVEILPDFDAGSDKLLVAADQQGKDIWSYIQEFPNFFHKDGIIYNLMQQTKHKVNGTHFTIPFLPGKTFCYSASNDVVQICLQTYGHFNVEPDIERKARNFYLTSNQPCHYHLTHSNNQIHSQYPRTQGFFSGPGQILMSQCEEAQMTLSPGKKDSDAEHKNISSYQRLGPGFSILGGEMSNVTNASLEKIQALAANIDPFLNFTKDQDADDLQGEKQNQMETT